MTLFLLGLLISGSAAIVLALVILQHREANGALPFALVMIASAIWAERRPTEPQPTVAAPQSHVYWRRHPRRRQL